LILDVLHLIAKLPKKNCYEILAVKNLLGIIFADTIDKFVENL